MALERLFQLCALLALYYITVAPAQNSQIPFRSRFTCQGRASGYYADIDSGCQVYHMCDGLGRQFSYTCPNTTLFQQRMLICDHWYMVNCTNSESDYSANLLIGQRDKPFVSDDEMRLRTPRPDILSVPPNNNYYDGLKEAETKFPIHPGNSIVGIADTISNSNNNGLDSAKNNYRPPASWSTGTGVTNQINTNNYEQDSLAGAASHEPTPTFQTTPDVKNYFNTHNTIPTPSPNLIPPDSSPPFSFPDKTTTEDYDIDVRMKTPADDPVYNFIKKFDPNSPNSHKTAMSRSEIIDLNIHLPTGQVSSEDDRPTGKNTAVNDFNRLNNDKKFTVASRFDTVNSKPTTDSIPSKNNHAQINPVPEPNRELLPPKRDFSEQPSTTMGPPVYYEWKWAVPALDLEPPNLNNNTNNATAEQQNKTIRGRSPFRDVTRPTPKVVNPSNTEYNISSYFIPDYVFPLDKPHPGYEDDNAQTSFQVKIGRKGRASFGENPACPQCHPAYLKPGTCEPCIVQR